jgi:hypothetical protein
VDGLPTIKAGGSSEDVVHFTGARTASQIDRLSEPPLKERSKASIKERSTKHIWTYVQLMCKSTHHDRRRHRVDFRDDLQRTTPILKVNSLIPDLTVMKNPSGMFKRVNPGPHADLVACRLHVVRDGHQTIALRYEVRVTFVRTSSAILTEANQGL